MIIFTQINWSCTQNFIKENFVLSYNTEISRDGGCIHMMSQRFKAKFLRNHFEIFFYLWIDLKYFSLPDAHHDFQSRQ